MGPRGSEAPMMRRERTEEQSFVIKAGKLPPDVWSNIGTALGKSGIFTAECCEGTNDYRELKCHDFRISFFTFFGKQPPAANHTPELTR